MKKIQRSLETAIRLLEQNPPSCEEVPNGGPDPKFYYNVPGAYCDHLDIGCSYQKEQGNEVICTYYETISLLLGDYLFIKGEFDAKK